MVDENMLKKYARLVIRTGVNIQEGQVLMINAPIEGAAFTRLVVKEAYEAGASDVQVNWGDDELQLMKYTYAPEEVLENFPDWRKLQHDSFVEKDGALLSIHATNPDLLKEVDPARIALASKAAGKGLMNFRKHVMNDELAWSVISIPTGDWAEKVFPEESREGAVERLWDAIFKIVRIDKDDPLTAWEEHNKTLHQAEVILNERRYVKLHLKGPGTDIEIGLPEGHIWRGGSTTSQKGITFNPNLPTEEVFSVPHKYNVNGTVSSTKPLNYGGSLIDNFQLTFKDGKVIDFNAEQGADSLKHLLDIDEGARRIGEIALVPHESPISQSGLIFYNTLFDENASCHIALGKAYPTNIEGGEAMNDEELDESGVNDSIEHVDFMVGSDQLNIDGVKADGKVEAVFRNGTWAKGILDE